MVYFNNNATSYPKPELVRSAVVKHLNTLPNDPYRNGFNTTSIVEDCRRKVCEFFHVSTIENVIFTSGSTEALNLAIFGLENPKHIITTTTEHNSVIRPLKTLEKEHGVKLSLIPCDNQGFVAPSDIEKEISKNTSAIIVNHCSNVTGAIQDIASISNLAQQHKIPFILDASQSAGNIEINLQETPVDFMAFTGHKSLFGSTGIGGLIINPEVKIKPLKVGGTGIRSDYLYQPESPLTIYYESGTHNTLGIASLSAGIEFINQIGIPTIQEHKLDVYNLIINSLNNNSDITLFGGTDVNNKVPVVNFKVANLNINDVAYMLSESFDIVVRAGLHCAPLIHKSLGSLPGGTVRASFSYFNTMEDANALINAINQVTCK